LGVDPQDQSNGQGNGAPTASASILPRQHLTDFTNWAGYGLWGTTGPWHQVSATWVIPAPSNQTPGQAEYSATWTGIGGGCTDFTCTATDPTLIQAGTEQDVDQNGNISIYAWYELYPQPEQAVPLLVNIGDTLFASVYENPPDSGSWSITIADQSTGGSWVSPPISYQSNYLTAEWVTERPTVNGSLSALPALTPVNFTSSFGNGLKARLAGRDKVVMVDYVGQTPPVAEPSLIDINGFNVCSYSATCTAP
jgi:hypothetical protein